MRKTIWIAPLITILLAGMLAISFSSSLAASDELTLVSPEACPASGCAAGQRLNFRISFSVNLQYTSDPNTQVCIYTPTSWVDYSDGWISDAGLESGANYDEGQTGSVCDNNKGSDLWITGAYATLPAGTTSDQLEFALRIDSDAVTNGQIKVKVFQADGSGVFSESFSESQSITVTPKEGTSYVAEAAADCGSHAPCYINSGDNDSDGLGTGLRDAVMAASPSSEILILDDYPIKSETVMIDKDILITAASSGASITYAGEGNSCSNPMLSFTNGGTIQDLTINDGNCTSPSRHLIEIDSAVDVTVEHNTLNSGYRAINILDNDGDVSIAFNQITNSLSFAVYRQTATLAGEVNIYANNIIDNRSGTQVNCNNQGSADYNFWGEGITAISSADNCTVSNGKQLGAPILTSSGDAGVEAVRQEVTGSTTYAFNNNIGVQHTLGNHYEVIIVNHGQGSEENIPFLEEGSGAIKACSNFYDVFLADGAVASDLVLTLKYDLNSSCISTIESSDYCGQSDGSEFPLWWYDPANDVTEGWDRTGQDPEGSASGGAYGQIMTCNTANNTISVTIDSSGRPNLNDDLHFTPFIAGLPLMDGVNLSEFSVTFDVTENDLKWITTSEVNIKGFHILRGNTENGTYSRVSPLIDAIGDTFIGGIYNYTDSNITFTRTYYYKLEVIADDGSSLEIYGPVSVLTSTSTPTPTYTRTPTLTKTPTLTRTPYATRTATLYYYRSPTSYYRPYTSTPKGGPTQVRTYGPSNTPTKTRISTNDTPSTTLTLDREDGYPMNTQIPQGTQAYPAPEDEGTDVTKTPTPDNGTTDQDPGDHQSDTGDTSQESPAGEQSGKVIQWGYTILGAAGGVILLAIVSIILAKSRFP